MKIERAAALFVCIAGAFCTGVLVSTTGAAAPVDSVQLCAESVLLGYRAEVESLGESASTIAPAPRLLYSDAVLACEGRSPDVVLYEDGSAAVLDGDHEYPPFRFRMAGR